MAGDFSKYRDAKKLALGRIGRGPSKRPQQLPLPDPDQDPGMEQAEELGEGDGCTCKSCPKHGAMVMHGMKLGSS